MKKIYEVGGTVNRGFVGQISYAICLNQPCDALDIHFSFEDEKRQYTETEITDLVKQEFLTACAPYHLKDFSEDKLVHTILNECKTEIHTIAYMNDTFIGGIHKQSSDIHMLYTATSTTEGCIPQDYLSGVIKVTLIFFNVIKDNTSYSLSISCQ